MKNKNKIWEIIKKEIRDVLRDKKTLSSMLLLPILLYPLMMGVMLVIMEDTLNTDISNYNIIGFAFETDDTLSTIIDEFEIEKVEGTEEELKTKLEEEEINSYITLKDNNFTIYYAGESTNGMYSAQLAYELIEGYKQTIQSHMLTSEGLVPDEIFNVYTEEMQDISSNDVSSEMMIGMMPSMILMTTTLAAGLAVIDMTAGEKERGTLETLLTFPIKKRDIIVGKFLATTICTTISGLLGFTSMYATLYYLSGKLETFSGVELLSVQSIILTIIAFTVFSLLVTALSMLMASRAKSFKEAQNSIQPLSLIGMIPMFLPMIGIKLNNIIALIPFVNLSMIMADIMKNSVNIQYFILMILSNLLFIVISLKAVVKLYKSDKILFS